MKVILFASLFFAIVVGLAVISYRIDNTLKIETSWLALGLAPFVIWLIATGQLLEFNGFGLAFKLSQAKSKPVSLALDGAMISPEPVSREEKGSIDKIEELKRERVSALTLQLNRQGYYANSAIRKYLEELTPLPFFKYVLFLTENGEFGGIISGSVLLEKMRSERLDIVSLIESGDISSIQEISAVSIPDGSSKQTALQIMDSHGLSELPVVNESQVFIGIVERNKITSSIVAQLVSSPSG